MSAICFVVSTDFHLDPWVKVDPVKEPIERNAMSSGNMSQIIILITVPLSSKTRKHACLRELCAVGGITSISSITRSSDVSDFFFLILLCSRFLAAWNSNTSMTKFHTLSAGTPVNNKPSSHKIICASVLLCETAICFLQDQPLNTNVRLPKMHKILPEVDFKTARSPAGSES